MELAVTQTDQGSYVPLKRMYRDPTIWCLATVELLYNRVMEIVQEQELRFSVEGNVAREGGVDGDIHIPKES